MSTIGDYASTIAAAIQAALPTAVILADEDPNALSRLRSTGALIIDIVFDSITYGSSEEIGAVHQGEVWRWLVLWEAPTREEGYAALEVIRSALAPTGGGFVPGTDGRSDAMEIDPDEPFGFVGRSQTGRFLFSAGLLHRRWEG